MRLAIGTSDLMLRLPGLPTSPNIRYLRRRKSRPLLLTHSNTILKLQVYHMVLHRPIECTLSIRPILSGWPRDLRAVGGQELRFTHELRCGVRSYSLVALRLQLVDEGLIDIRRSC